MNVSETTALVTLTGRDRPGVTSRLFAALAGGGELTVLDIEQVVIRGRLCRAGGQADCRYHAR